MLIIIIIVIICVHSLIVTDATLPLEGVSFALRFANSFFPFILGVATQGQNKTETKSSQIAVLERQMEEGKELRGFKRMVKNIVPIVSMLLCPDTLQSAPILPPHLLIVFVHQGGRETCDPCDVSIRISPLTFLNILTLHNNPPTGVRLNLPRHH